LLCSLLPSFSLFAHFERFFTLREKKKTMAVAASDVAVEDCLEKDCLEKDWSENGTKHNAAAWEWWDRVGRPKTWLAPMVGQVLRLLSKCICVGARD
jgi:hypothetical protein